MGGIITEDNGTCFICGAGATAVHHVLGGVANRPLSDEDGLTVPLCPACHNLFQGARPRGWGCDVHHCPKLMRLMRALGQMAWERDHERKGGEGAREAFRRRYGKSYL